jgi:hypothetical protein
MTDFILAGSSPDIMSAATVRQPFTVPKIVAATPRQPFSLPKIVAAPLRQPFPVQGNLFSGGDGGGNVSHRAEGTSHIGRCERLSSGGVNVSHRAMCVSHIGRRERFSSGGCRGNACVAAASRVICRDGARPVSTFPVCFFLTI